MPHECTSCGLTFPDGSKEMLSGCPDCGGNKFQFHPGGVSPDETHSSPSSPEAVSENHRGDTTASKSTDSSFTLGSLRSEEAGSDPPNGAPEASPVDPKASPADPEASESPDSIEDDSSPNTEDRAQASARSTVPSGDELHESDPGRTSRTAPSDPDASRTAPEATGDTEVTEATGDVSEPSDDSDSPDISELREELNEQFESIKIHARGEYELNLMELYDREEHIIALQEDGRYVIDVPSSWREADEDD